ncbi:MAG TPA: BREX system ATP-binding domain-containing protein [Thermomicrobiales bacterium]|nr:BREX system ATP-binding domain-containing protein [Thermomicrobiales bacterium]
MLVGQAASEPGRSIDASGRDGARSRIVGREREIGALRDQLRDVLDGHGRLVLISGEAGIGKTTLVANLADVAVAHGCLVLWGHAYDLSVTPPYGPWLELLRRYPAATNGLPLLPAVVEDGRSLATVGSQESLFATVATFFRAVANQTPLVLVLDDLHWADQASLDFLRYLARQISHDRILLLATYRSDEIHRHHPLFDLLPLLVRESGAERLEVHRLDAAGHRALVANRYTLPQVDTDRLVQYLELHAEGNPLFALELLRTLEDEGNLRQTDAGWSLGDAAQVRVPPLLRQVIDRRLARLGDNARSLLQVAAIIGQEVPLDLWQQIVEASDDALIDAIEQGQVTNLLDEVAGGASYRFQHALLREALYEGVVSLRRRSWHRKVAEALATQPNPVPDVVAYHFQQAGDVRAVAWLLESGRRARMAYATASAIDRFETALALDEQHDGASGLRGWLLAGLATCGALYSNTDERLRTLNEAMDFAAQTNDDVLMGLCEWSSTFLATSGPGSALQLYKARDRIQALPPEDRGRLYGFIYGSTGVALDPSGPDMTCEIVGLQGQSGQVRETLAAVERIREEYPRLSATAELGVDNALMTSFQALGRPDDSLRHYEHMQAVHRRNHVTDWIAITTWLKLRDLVLVYWPDRIATRLEVASDSIEAIRLAKAEGTLGPDVPDETGAIWLYLVDGRWDDARRVVEVATSAGQWITFLTAAAWMTLTRHQGDPEAALARLPITFPDGPASQPGRQTFETSVLCMHAAIEIALDAGDLALARAWLECHDRWLDWSGHIPFTTIGHRLWARYHHVSGDRAAAIERANQALELASDPRQPLTLLGAHRLLGELETDGGNHGNARQHLAEALALADACQAPFERALTLVALAELALASSDIGGASPHLADARAICEPLGARPTLERIGALEAQLAAAPRQRHPAGLSAREVEVLRLVAEGLTDAEVAERLFLSRRTVSTHLTSIYTKLGVNSRTAATRFAVEHGIT